MSQSPEDKELTPEQMEVVTRPFPTADEAGFPTPEGYGHWLMAISFSARNVLDRANLGCLISALKHPELVDEDAPFDGPGFKVVAVVDADRVPMVFVLLIEPGNAKINGAVRGAQLALTEEPWLSKDFYIRELMPYIIEHWKRMDLDARFTALQDLKLDQDLVLDEKPPAKLVAALEQMWRHQDYSVSGATAEDDAPPEPSGG